MKVLDKKAKKVLDKINSLEGQELKSYIRSNIKYKTQLSRKQNTQKFIGFDIDSNLNHKNVSIENPTMNFEFKYNPCFIGYIPKDIKIVYGRFIDEDYNVGSKGYYYYMDNNEYLYDFINFIKGKDIESNQHLVFLAYFFINNYFGYIETLSREDLHKLIFKKDGKYFDPIKEHSILDFKQKACAMCSEYSALVQNILSFFNYETTLIIGETNNDIIHAFNIAIIENAYYIIDFAYGIDLYNALDKNQITMPYIMRLDGFNNDVFKSFMDEEKMLETDNCFASIINDHYYSFPTNDKRQYKILSKKI